MRLHKAVCIWADEFWRGIAAGAGDMRFVADSKDAVQEGKGLLFGRLVWGLVWMSPILCASCVHAHTLCQGIKAFVPSRDGKRQNTPQT